MQQISCCVCGYIGTLSTIIRLDCLSLVQAHFALNSQREWAESDGDFDYEEYYNYILALFDDKEWCEATLDWYNG
ncbi:uncharacterized protein LAESUDRAFT_658485 [Laetiporus sulphureus 93-53]|uniref:Uncharacterized protein n=1 Tax=Laetiporus sulphureus 93-53 TaxID=1314785 RepID=A0A165D2U0_9APHY|nr:uncharacterized protein LAESUDRAFT_658485 [Laetiporus sulphureus 93-53]KZT04048.1 hypothetical protein LAESUDRAFT_658485 [Laetiporus sulphureus 93-53]